MTFDEALAECKPGQFFKPIHWGWNEYTCQYGKSADGKPFWTAGMTCGGDLTPDRMPRRHEVNNVEYGIYEKFYDDHAIKVWPNDARPVETSVPS